jgi:hypothetical protein
MHGPAFGCIAASEMLVVVQLAWFRVTTEGKTGTCIGHRVVNQAAKFVNIQVGYFLASQATARTQIEDNRLFVRVDDRCSFADVHSVPSQVD